MPRACPTSCNALALNGLWHFILHDATGRPRLCFRRAISTDKTAGLVSSGQTPQCNSQPPLPLTMPAVWSSAQASKTSLRAIADGGLMRYGSHRSSRPSCVTGGVFAALAPCVTVAIREVASNSATYIWPHCSQDAIPLSYCIAKQPHDIEQPTLSEDLRPNFTNITQNEADFTLPPHKSSLSNEHLVSSTLRLFSCSTPALGRTDSAVRPVEEQSRCTQGSR